VLPAGTAEPGTPLRKAVPAVYDDVLEIGVTPNRPDALGHVGIAREVAALLELPFGVPEPTAPNRVLQAKVEGMARVSIADDAKERCAQYTGVVVVDLEVAPSPLWMRYRLHALGVRSISNLVDVTNLVMLEYAQPLHAFDLDHLDGSAIHVRLARKGEQLITLDGVTRTLVEDDLVICDGAPNGGKPVALAGVMGGGNSEISSTTKRVLLECAYFEPRSVRRSARRHGLHTEASHRFERGVDPGAIADVAAQAAALMVRLGKGAAVSGMLNALGKTFEPTKLSLRHARIEHLLGVAVPQDEAAAVLDRLGCEPSPWKDGVSSVTVPTHRPDLQREVDLIEEIARVRGFDRIPSELPAITPHPPRSTGVVERRTRHFARELGLSEGINYAFTSPRELEAVGAPKVAVRLKNPLGEERSVMRTSLLPGVLSSLARARRRGERKVRLFEVGARFVEGGADAAAGLCDEIPSFAAVLAGPRDTWIGRGEDVDVYDAKGIALSLVERLTGKEPTVAPMTKDRAVASALHPRGAAEVRVGDRVVGTFGPLHPDVVDRLELDGPAMIVELDLRAIEELGARTPKYRPLPTLPAATRDVALLVGNDVTAGALAEALRAGGGTICESVEIFDVYRGQGVPEGHKSVAFRLVYRDPQMAKTLTDAEVDAQHAKAIAATQPLGASPRT
jgi:phenylalanyl-tRNA synthetase beta chain